ncbi:YceI family protein [Maribacter sp. PR1]|uniref:YceI family protein n=1 Tax=Maribacter cobaltidurans TaxID=1178778 RepID=A0ABU7IP45_9FLAO|nr:MULTISPECIES: YceI family protein [Maribacter]MDC6387047.1 YceI family protein [Maribacter sp. PR1]MEE1974433.1 YceI family protein [Maribacter cobaltidurans]
MEKTNKWVIDPTHSEVSFKVKHMMISRVTGHFEEFEATIDTENDKFENASLSVEIGIGSINTKNKDRDAHLMSEDFFKADEYPKMAFTSKSFTDDKIIGDLTIRDVTKEVTLDVDFNGIAVDPYGQTKAGFEISGKINRKDFNLTWSAVTEAGNVVVSDQVKMVIDAQFIKQ